MRDFIYEYWYWIIIYTVSFRLVEWMLKKVFKRTYKTMLKITKKIIKPLGVFKNSKVLLFVQLFIIIGLVVYVLIIKM